MQVCSQCPCGQAGQERRVPGRTGLFDQCFNYIRRGKDMVKTIFLLLVVLFWYGVAVCVVQTVKHCTTREAASFCIQKIKEVFAWSWKEAFAKPPVQYMTHIGWDGERQCFNPKVADEELVELGKLFLHHYALWRSPYTPGIKLP